MPALQNQRTRHPVEIAGHEFASEQSLPSDWTGHHYSDGLLDAETEATLFGAPPTRMTAPSSRAMALSSSISRGHHTTSERVM
jgi:hypothetical protein